MCKPAALYISFADVPVTINKTCCVGPMMNSKYVDKAYAHMKHESKQCLIITTYMQCEFHNIDKPYICKTTAASIG